MLIYGMKLAIGTLWMACVFGSAMAQGWVSDTLTGRGAAGPYTLTWNRIVERSEIVLLDTRWLTRDADYTIDYAAGQIRFVRALHSGQIARVSYRIQLGTSQHNTNTDIPIETELARRGPASLSLRGRITGEPNRPTTDLGLRAAWQEQGREGEALYLFRNPHSGNAPALLQLRSHWRTDTGWQGGIRFSRVDRDFGDAKPYGLTSGYQTAEANLLYQPDAQLRTHLQWSLQDPIVGNQHAQQRWSAGLNYKLEQIQLGLERQIADSGAQATEVMDRTRVQMQPTNTVRMKLEQESRTQGDYAVQQTQVHTQLGQSVELRHRTTDDSRAGRAEESGVAMRFGPPKVQGSIGLEQRWRDDAQQRTAQLGLQAQLDPRLRIGGEFEAIEDAGQMRGFQIQAQPANNLQLTLREREYQGLRGLNLRSQQLQWDWRMSGGLALSGQVAQHPLSQGAPQSLHLEQYQLRWNHGAWNFEAGYWEQQHLGQLLTERRYTLNLRRQLDAFTILGLSYQQSEWERDAFLREAALRLGLTRQLSGFYLSAEMQMRLPRNDAQPQQRPNYSGSLRLGVQF
ncbi:MAG: hypothetical protein KatS3mg019_0141 [Fimbriimonadales bacterium]|nr:MAG: hypothetical protein KatS3mg019_0141 [Fimbriimonadales bacterium]